MKNDYQSDVDVFTILEDKLIKALNCANEAEKKGDDQKEKEASKKAFYVSSKMIRYADKYADLGYKQNAIPSLSLMPAALAKTDEARMASLRILMDVMKKEYVTPRAKVVLGDYLAAFRQGPDKAEKAVLLKGAIAKLAP